MNQHNLLVRLRAPEDGFVERKLEGLKPADLRRTLVAFANSVPEGREAVLFIGVSDHGEIEGCTNTDAKQKDVRRTCDHECYPPLTSVSSEVLTVGGKALVAVVVGPSGNRPHFTGQAYIRRGSETVVASAQQFDELVHSRNSLVSAILRHRDEVFTVESIGYLLGNSRYIASRDSRQHAECRLVECNPQFIRLKNIASSETYSEPLSHVDLMSDEQKHRPKLIVRGYR